MYIRGCSLFVSTNPVLYKYSKERTKVLLSCEKAFANHTIQFSNRTKMANPVTEGGKIDGFGIKTGIIYRRAGSVIPVRNGVHRRCNGSVRSMPGGTGRGCSWWYSP